MGRNMALSMILLNLVALIFLFFITISENPQMFVPKKCDMLFQQDGKNIFKKHKKRYIKPKKDDKNLKEIVLRFDCDYNRFLNDVIESYVLNVNGVVDLIEGNVGKVAYFIRVPKDAVYSENLQENIEKYMNCCGKGDCCERKI